MPLRLVQLDETNLSAFEALLAQVWRQNWAPELARALIRWRYHDRASGGGTWLVCDEGQCVAMLDSFVRPYLLDGRRLLVREGCDWYCLPKYRPLGLGIRLMRKMMACPEPMISIGGRDATLEILPRLGWARLPDVQGFMLPVTARSVASALLRKRWPWREAYASAVPGFIPVRRPRKAPAPPLGVGRVCEWQPGRFPALPVPERQGLVQLLDPADLDWMSHIPRVVAQPLALVFFLDDTPVGFSLSQIEPAIAGIEGRIVHLQIAHRAQAIADWVVAETAWRLAARGAGIIRSNASSTEKVVALRKAGFVGTGPLPSYWWPKPGVPIPIEVDLGYLRADDAIPFPALRGRHLAASVAGPPRAAAHSAADQQC